MVIAYIDGSCGPFNPGGSMGFGVYVLEDHKNVYSWAGSLESHPSNSNNVAEYIALENCLDYLFENGYAKDDITINTDSLLVKKQMNSEWKMISGRYHSCAKRCFKKVPEFTDLKIRWIPRDQNTIADTLSKAYFNS